MGRDSSVGIANRYGLDSLGIESPWEASLSAPVQTGPGAHSVFLGGEAGGAWRWPSTPPSAKVKERVELYIYSTSRPSWLILG